MDYEKVLGERKFPTYEQLKNDLLRLIDERKISWEDAARVLPELRESEDERIREALVEYFSQPEDIDTIQGVRIEKVRAWLEKQKEQKEELVYRLNGLMQEYINESKDEAEQEHRFKCYKLFWDALEDMSYFDKQKEQKSTTIPERIRPKFSVGDTVCRNGYVDHTVIEIYLWKDPVYVCKNDEGLESHISFSEQDKWEKKEQKPVEWSEEDELHLKAVLGILGQKNHPILYKFVESIRPQPHWKPSEEQMAVLFNAEGLMRANDYKENAKILANVIEELKKL